MASGLMALEEMIADLDVGPRRDAEQTDRQQTPPEGRIQPATSDGKDAASPKGPTNAAYFGFGPSGSSGIPSRRCSPLIPPVWQGGRALNPCIGIF